MSAPFDRLLFMNLRVPMIFLGIARRKGVVLSEPQWTALSNQTGASVVSLAVLYRRALLLPSLLERADLFLRNKPMSTSPGQLMRDLCKLRTDILRWSINDPSFSDKMIRNHDTVYVSDVAAFDMNVEEHLVLTTNNIFDSFFKFKSYRFAEDMTLYWLFCLIIDCTLLRIMQFQPVTEVCIKPRTQAETLRDAHIRARYLCRSVFFYSHYNSQGITGYIDTLVALAKNFFSEIRAVKELGWCQAVRCATKLRVQRLRTFQPRTLCRMGDMADDLATATKFRSRPVKPEKPR